MKNNIYNINIIYLYNFNNYCLELKLYSNHKYEFSDKSEEMYFY